MYDLLLATMLLGHVLGDYYFRIGSPANGLGESLLRFILWHLVYGLTVSLCAVPLFGFDLLPVIAVLVGWRIANSTALRFIYRRSPNEQRSLAIYFAVTQILTLFLIGITVAWMTLRSIPLATDSGILPVTLALGWDLKAILVWATAGLLILRPSRYTIAFVLERFRVAEWPRGLTHAGALIGVLERAIVLLLLAVGQFGAIGLVLTAKSIARYKSISECINFSEYYLIGTLLSNLAVIGIFLYTQVMA